GRFGGVVRGGPELGELVLGLLGEPFQLGKGRFLDRVGRKGGRAFGPKECQPIRSRQNLTDDARHGEASLEGVGAAQSAHILRIRAAARRAEPRKQPGKKEAVTRPLTRLGAPCAAAPLAASY